jgi:ATP-dependent DNA helicase RecG
LDTDVVGSWASQPEGQLFERKSAWERSGPAVRRRQAAAIAADVAETLSAMANADGGELIVGIEDDGKVTGVDQPDDKLELIKEAARVRCLPPVEYRSDEVLHDGLLLLHFSVEWSPVVHDLTDGRTLLRVRDQNMPFSQADVAALKATKAQGLVERQCPAGATLADVDMDLVETLRQRLRPASSAEAVLALYGLVESRGGHMVPNLACLLLFGRDPSRPRSAANRGSGPRLNKKPLLRAFWSGQNRDKA